MKRNIRLIDFEAKNASRNLFYADVRTKYVATVIFIGTPLIASARIRVKVKFDHDVLSEPGFWYVILITLGIMVVVVALNFIFKYIVGLIRKVLAREGNTQGSGFVENMKEYDCNQAQMALGSFASDAMSESGEAENASDEEVEMLPVDENEIENAAVEADAKCTFCGSMVSDDETYSVDFDNYKMSDGSRASVELLIPCCAVCRDKMLERGADMVSLRNNAQIKEALSNGARFSEEWLAEQDRIKAEYRMKREMERR